MSEEKKTQEKKDILKPGMTVKVHEKIKELNAKGEEKERVQVFEGIILAVNKPGTQSGTFTVRKMSEGVGVEKIFPIHSPLIDKIVPVKQASIRRAKLYFLRGSKKRLSEKKIS